MKEEKKIIEGKFEVNQEEKDDETPKETPKEEKPEKKSFRQRAGEFLLSDKPIIPRKVVGGIVAGATLIGAIAFGAMKLMAGHNAGDDIQALPDGDMGFGYDYDDGEAPVEIEIPENVTE